MGKTEGNSNKLILRRTNNSSLFQIGIYSVHRSDNEKIENYGFSDKLRKIEFESFSINSSSRYENKLSTHEPRDTQGKGKGSEERSG
ncbi:hypothetical protein AYI69_g6859 [Smittium culicis]|uniref:Uncharacterized protein n=1 Tax=Smittium culicis TaxID=133412 RepID=A0A1R1XVZ4_9FUNG|nr:hypothetical protein AYI69_g6859 [Smittium culicis]